MNMILPSTGFFNGRKLFLIAIIFLSHFYFSQNALQNQMPGKMEAAKTNFTSFTTIPENRSAWSKFNSDTYTSHSEFGKFPSDAVFPGYVEVLEKRKTEERYFVDENFIYFNSSLETTIPNI